MKKSGRQRKNKMLKYKTDFPKKNFLRLSLYSLAVKKIYFDGPRSTPRLQLWVFSLLKWVT